MKKGGPIVICAVCGWRMRSSKLRRHFENRHPIEDAVLHDALDRYDREHGKRPERPSDYSSVYVQRLLVEKEMYWNL